MTQNESYEVYRLARTQKASRTTNTLIFDAPLPGAQPGQFVMIWLPGIGEKPFSILNDEPFSVAVAPVGPFSETLNKMKVGGRVWVRGPFGQGFKPHGSRHLLAGGGYGAAPLFFLAEHLKSMKNEVSVCLGARSSEGILLDRDFEALGCAVRVATEDGSIGKEGLVTQIVASFLDESDVDTLYACGPVGMLGALSQLGRRRNLATQLSWEARMRCGIGLCGSCELEQEVREAAGIPAGWLACRDGPVYITSPQ